MKPRHAFALVGPPSDGKTPALDIVAEPIRDLDHRYYREFREALLPWEEEVAAAKREKRPTLGEKPIQKRIDVDDTTMEALKAILAENPRGVGWFLDELAVFLMGLNQYKAGGKGNDRPTACKLWGGKGFKTDRIQTGHARSDFSHCSIVGGLVPDGLRDLRDTEGRADGFLERFQMHYPVPTPVPPWTDAGVDDEAKRRWADVIRDIASDEMVHDPETGRDNPAVTRLTEAAKSEFVRLYDAHAADMNALDFLPSLRAGWGKFREVAGRAALVLARLRFACETRIAASPIKLAFSSIKEDDILNAWRLVEYWKAGFLRVKATIEGADGGSEDTAMILRWLRSGRPTAFAERELYRAVGRFRENREDMTESLLWLQSKHVIRPIPTAAAATGAGRKPSPTWEVNPALYTMDLGQNGHNGRNSAEGGGSPPASECLDLGQNGHNGRNSADETPTYADVDWRAPMDDEAF